jgi:hypothetical protein
MVRNPSCRKEQASLSRGRRSEQLQTPVQTSWASIVRQQCKGDGAKTSHALHRSSWLQQLMI